ncbi:MAG TPA: methyltransferase domain-containing protein [Myxococcota bacterium]|nr:methyltransferase domain-containing protein [Myxococcota bacterium]
MAFAVALACAPSAAFADGATEAERLAKLLDARAGSRIADIGAGEGELAVEIAKRVGPSGRVYATELAEEERAAIRERARAEGVANVEVIEAQISATGLPTACCDAVFLRNVYHHLSDPSAIAKDIQRALVPGGTLVVIDFPPTWFLAPWSPEGVGEERSGHGITIEAALRELESAGFTRVDVIESWSDRWLAGDEYALVLRAPGGPAR